MKEAKTKKESVDRGSGYCQEKRFILRRSLLWLVGLSAQEADGSKKTA